MIKPVPVGEIFDYTLPEDKEDPTIWKLSAVDSLVKSRIAAKLMTLKFDPKNPKITEFVAGSTEDAMELDVQILKFGLKGFSNFKLNGKDIPFETEEIEFSKARCKVASEKTLGYLPRSIISKLSTVIWKASEVSEGEEKNS